MSKIKLNKKGFLLGEETVKIILAVVAIVFLVFLLYSLYNNYSNNQDLEYAKSSLTYLMGQINSKSASAEIYNPNGWNIASFPQAATSRGGSTMPKSCSSVGWENCICIYKLQGSFFGIPNAADSADKEGTCQQSDFVITGSSATNAGGIAGGTYVLTKGIPIQNPPVTLAINYQTKTIQSGSGTQFSG